MGTVYPVAATSTRAEGSGCARDARDRDGRAVVRLVDAHLGGDAGAHLADVAHHADAATAVAQAVEDVEHLLHSEHLPQEARTLSAFQRLAANLGALGFLIDMLNVQPVVAKSLFQFDPLLGVLSPVMGRSAVSADVISRAEAIADAVQHDEISLDAVAADLRALQDDAQVTALPALAAHLSAARYAIDHDHDEAPAPLIDMDVLDRKSVV